MPLDAISEDDWLHNDVGPDNVWSNDVTESWHNTWRYVSKFGQNSVCVSFFDALYASTSSNNSG